MNKSAPNNQMVFAVGNEPDGSPIVIFGVTEAAWNYMREGKTHNFDLTRLGLPFKVMCFGAKDYAEARAILSQARGEKADLTHIDFSIKPKGDA